MTRFYRWTAVAAAALACVAGAHAQSNVQIYGLADMSAGQFQVSGAKKVYRADSGNMTTSYLGFKGIEDLGGGLKAKFALEHFLQYDNGAPGRFTGDTFWARNAYVGLQGAFGSTQLGRNTNPFFVSTLVFNAIGDSFGFSPAIRQVLTPHPSFRRFQGDTGWSNSLLYTSPNIGGATINFIGNLNENRTGSQLGKNLGVNAIYFGGPISATVAAQRVRNGLTTATGTPQGFPAGFKSQDSYQLGAAYDANIVKVFGQFTQEKNRATVDTKATIYGTGAQVPIGAGKVLAQYGYVKATVGGLRTTQKTFTGGYDYNLSKNTDIYAIYMYDKVSRLDKGNTLAGGIRLRF